MQSSFATIAVDFSDAPRHYTGMKLLERITVEPNKCGGRPCIRGLRIRVTDMLGMLAEGVSHEEILRDFPYLEPDDIKRRLLTRRARPTTPFCNRRELRH